MAAVPAPAPGSAPRLAELPLPAQLEAEVLAFWKAERIFARSLDAAKDRPPFVFYEGPPTANGMPHNGHVLTRVMKDVFPRYRTMRGYRVERRAGWDTHGLPVEVEVEKLLGIHGKAAIEAYGVEPFARACIDSVFTYTREWEELTERIGFWLDMDSAYVTYHRSYVESVWWALSELFKKGLLYQDYKVVWWWPQGGTALSSGEMGEGYQNVEDPSATVRFRVTGDLGSALPSGFTGVVSLLAWTTTPWTLPSNVALAVNPDLDYVLVERHGEILIVAQALREQVEGEVVAVMRGSELVGLTYQPLYTFALPEGGRSYEVVPGAHVAVDTGTGIVHTAPAFGEEDFALRKAENLGFLQLIAPDGRFVEGTGFLEGRFCKDADPVILADLHERGLLFANARIRHEYPFCPRASSDPLIQYARPAWFIRTRAHKDDALANNAAVNWLPETIRDGRFGDFLRNNVDWALSRERFWGTPLNIWSCEGCGHRDAPASAAEILARNPEAFDTSVPVDLQVHKPWIDRVTLPCGQCGATMRRVPEVIDCWFDSGCMPFAQVGFPHQGVDEFKRSFPADFISEAIDQTRGWFYSLLMISTLLFDEETCRRYGLDAAGYPRPYRTCIVLGHVCDADGKKESKSKGNYTSPDLVLKGSMKAHVKVDSKVRRGAVGMKPAQVKSLGLGTGEKLTTPDGHAFDVIAHNVTGKDSVAMHPDDAARVGAEVLLSPPYPPPGADAFRWLFFASSPPWANTRLSLKAILEGQREFLFRLKNVHQFYVLNASGHTPSAPRAVHVLDRWILHSFTQLQVDVTRWLDGYLVYEPARAIQDFVDALSNWWLRRSRDRFDSDDARDTLFHVLVELSKLIAPFVPFMAEAMYRSLRVAGLRAAPDAGIADVTRDSVHLCDWPAPRTAWIDASLGERMSLVREIASLGLSARAMVGVRVRQPLASAEVVLANPGAEGGLRELIGLVRDELNVRTVHFSTDAGRFVSFRLKPDFKVLGARLGKDMKAAAAALALLEPGAARAALLGGGLTLDVGGRALTLVPGDVLIEVAPLPGYQAAGSAQAVVALQATLDEDLLEEGLAREVISRIQGIRKAWGLGYGEPIRVTLGGAGRAARMQERFVDLIAGSTVATVEEAPTGGDTSAPTGSATEPGPDDVYLTVRAGDRLETAIVTVQA